MYTGQSRILGRPPVRVPFNAKATFVMRRRQLRRDYGDNLSETVLHAVLHGYPNGGGTVKKLRAAAKETALA